MHKTPFDLSGKVALVTGANTGLGQGISIALAQAGADIVLIGRSEPEDTIQQRIIKRNEAIDFTPDEWDAVMNVNLRTLFFLSQAFARHIMALC